MYLIEIRLYSTVHCTLYSTLSTVYIEGVTLIWCQVVLKLGQTVLDLILEGEGYTSIRHLINKE